MASVTSLPLAPAREHDTTARIPEDSRAFAGALARANTSGVVAPAHTPLSGEEAASALSDAFRSVTGRAPTAKQLALLTAQWSLETGGGRAMMNYNFGGIKGRSPEGLTVAYKTKEGSGPTERTLVDRFRAYSSARAGAEDYVRTLATRFPHAMAALHTGDAAAFAHALKTEGYYTASEADYTRAIASLSSRAERGGFGAIGQPGGPHASVAVSAYDDDLRAVQSACAVDAIEMAAQMSRAAMQIAGGDDEATFGPRRKS